MEERLEQARYVLLNDLEEIPQLAERVEAFGVRHAVSSKVIFNLNLALDEILTNVISYGYPDHLPHHISVTLMWRPEGMTAEVEDDGLPFNPLADAAPPQVDVSLEERSVGGLGIHFVKTFMDEVSYCREGERNRLRLWKRLEGSGREAAHDPN
ncbi:MAG: ATP-binding protein [Magnetococcales bacterium]|nr:ATP-binding protein [Magnetococcales bacterium]